MAMIQDSLTCFNVQPHWNSAERQNFQQCRAKSWKCFTSLVTLQAWPKKVLSWQRWQLKWQHRKRVCVRRTGELSQTDEITGPELNSTLMAQLRRQWAPFQTSHPSREAFKPAHHDLGSFCDQFTNTPLRAASPDWVTRTSVWTKLLCLWLQYSTYYLSPFPSSPKSCLIYNNQKYMAKGEDRSTGNIQITNFDHTPSL